MGAYKPGKLYKYELKNAENDKPPSIRGDYKIYDKNGEVKYSGITNDLRRRMHEHKRSGKLGENDCFEYRVAEGYSTPNTRSAREQEKISRRKLQQNKTKGRS